MGKSAWFVGGIAMAVAWSASPARATEYTVTTTAMTEAWDGACSLVEAINASSYMAANHECGAGTGQDTIWLGGGTYTTNWSFYVYNDLTINGSGTPYTIIAGNFASSPQDNVFSVNGRLVINNLTVRNDTGPPNPDAGLSPYYTTGITVWDEATLESGDGLRVTKFTWAGIRAMNALVVLTHARIDNNTNFYPQVGPNDGGGISFKADVQGKALTINDSAIVSNKAGGNGGGLYCTTTGNSQFHYDTFAKNEAVKGGGIYSAPHDGGYFQSSHLTIGANTATSSGGGIEEHQSSGTLLINDAIVANNSAPSGANVVKTYASGQSLNTVWGVGVTAASLGCSAAFQCNSKNLYGKDAKFGPLMAMGGTYYQMEVLPLLNTSPAIDRGADAEPWPEDQRGMSGNQDGDGANGSARDSGAFEKNLIWESEQDLQWTSSNGTVVIDSNTGYSGGLGRRLQATGSGSTVTYVIPIAESGTYSITIRYKMTSTAGKFKVGTKNAPTGTFTFFTTEPDGFSNTTSVPPATTLGSQAFTVGPNGGNYYVRFQVTGKNPLSNGYDIFTDYVKVVKTGN